ncbi:PREDICTED: protein disulfide-isomerase 5-2-like [Lupinus angustifolius]|uniref:protein disulfide-isomerase 5-2-like n=1 Tax=Lupinus angustifolius TaxID=3871 RepID=UPI00092FB809|nr:PREDICTED: protein disulfide-isomerase 5-2-like [Lupinus angustifolius]XP_019427761.1 PREDICTED: protein disulfide-isomerase 5-2-like [Lupinus angustifolius]
MITKMKLLLVIGVVLLIHFCSVNAEPFLSVDGKVLVLDESNFESAISSFDHILVDFYAPWCGHCKRLSPELDAAAPVLAALKNPIVIAKVDADKFTRLAKKYDVDAYPTILLFNHGIPTEYHGPRKAELLVRYLKKFAASDVSILDSDSAVNKFVEEAGTFFPVYIGFGLDSSAIEKLAIKYKKNAWFSVAKDFSEDLMVSYDFDKVPALVSLNPKYNEHNTFYGPFEGEFLEDFVKQNLIPLAVPVSHDTLKLLEGDDRKIVLTIVEDEDEERSRELVKLLKAAASANRDLIFGYVGVKQREEFAEKFDIGTKLPKMVIWDKSDDYLSVVGSESIEGEDQATQITKFVEGYREGRTIKKTVSGPSLMKFINGSFDIRMVYFLVFIVAVVMLIQNINKGDDEHNRIPNQDHVHHASSVSEVENKEYKAGDKQD